MKAPHRSTLSAAAWGWTVAVLLTALTVGSQSAVAQSLPDFTPLVEKYSKAVVNISTTQKRRHVRSTLPKGFDLLRLLQTLLR
jgi:S1-C subfamily serine protease